MGRRNHRKSKRLYTAAERDELVAHVTREQDVALEALIVAQGEVERLKAAYYRHRATIARLMAEPVFEEQWQKARAVAGNGLREAI